jgi:beta-glucosidase-like glycosyl hydrolase
VASVPLPQARLDAALRRIIRLKVQLGILTLP